MRRSLSSSSLVSKAASLSTRSIAKLECADKADGPSTNFSSLSSSLLLPVPAPDPRGACCDPRRLFLRDTWLSSGTLLVVSSSSVICGVRDVWVASVEVGVGAGVGGGASCCALCGLCAASEDRNVFMRRPTLSSLLSMRSIFPSLNRTGLLEMSPRLYMHG